MFLRVGQSACHCKQSSQLQCPCHYQPPATHLSSSKRCCIIFIGTSFQLSDTLSASFSRYIYLTFPSSRSDWLVLYVIIVSSGMVGQVAAGTASPHGIRSYNQMSQSSAVHQTIAGGVPTRQPSSGNIRMRRDSANNLRQLPSSYPPVSSSTTMAQNAQVCMRGFSHSPI